MWRFTKILCAVLGLSLLLCGCQKPEEEVPAGDQTVSCQELILTLPPSYVNLSDQDYAAEFDLLYGFEQEAVLAFAQNRAALEPYYPNINAEQYAMRLAEVNNYDCQVGKLGDLVTFTYHATTDDIDFTYLCGIFASTENFWCVQFYCPSEDFADNEGKFMGYLQKIEIRETLTN